MLKFWVLLKGFFAVFMALFANFLNFLRATAGHLLRLSVTGVGHSQFYRGPGTGHLRTPERPRAFDTCF